MLMSVFHEEGYLLIVGNRTATVKSQRETTRPQHRGATPKPRWSVHARSAVMPLMTLWPDPRKVDWLESESCRKRKARHERQKAQSGADSKDTQGSRRGQVSARGNSSARHYGADLLSVEEGICRDGTGGHQEAQGDPGREHAFEKAGGRSGVEDSAPGGWFTFRGPVSLATK
jgi:hypothetical protein